jgi:hypothetical protein
VWKGINSYTYSKENALVAELEKQNEDKFNLVKDIINTEIVKNNKLKAELQEMFAVSTKKVALVDNSQISIYEGELEKYNEDTLNKLKNILNYDENNFIE